MMQLEPVVGEVGGGFVACGEELVGVHEVVIIGGGGVERGGGGHGVLELGEEGVFLRGEGVKVHTDVCMLMAHEGERAGVDVEEGGETGGGDG